MLLRDVIPPRGADMCKITRQRAGALADGHGVVVEHKGEIRRGLASVVKPLICHSASKRAVAYHRRNGAALAFQPHCGGNTVCCGNRGAAVPRNERVRGGFSTAAEARNTVPAAQC